MEFYVYILYSEPFDKYYIGQTNNLNDRLRRHNSGSEKFTQPFAPWILKWNTLKETRSEAMALEKKLKNLSKICLNTFMDKYSGGTDEASLSAC